MTDVASEVSTGVPQPAAAETKTNSEEDLAALQALEQNAGVLPEIEMMLREQLRKGITSTTLEALFAGLGFYLEADAVVSLLTILTRGDDAAFIAQVKAQASAQTWDWLRRLLALYGRDLQEAHYVSGEHPESWREIDRHVYYNALSGKWSIHLDILKYSGAHLLLEESPHSALSLARGIVETLNSVPPEAATGLIQADAVQRFADVVTQFFAVYAPGAAEPPEKAVQGDSEEAAKCPQCGQENRPTARFCSKCGQSLAPGQ
jgi:hypothetical protein